MSRKTELTRIAQMSHHEQMDFFRAEAKKRSGGNLALETLLYYMYGYDQKISEPDVEDGKLTAQVGRNASHEFYLEVEGDKLFSSAYCDDDCPLCVEDPYHPHLDPNCPKCGGLGSISYESRDEIEKKTKDGIEYFDVGYVGHW